MENYECEAKKQIVGRSTRKGMIYLRATYADRETTVFQYINANIDRIKLEINIGLIPCAILRHWQIYSRYDYYKKLGNSTCNAIIFTGEDLKVKERWVYSIIKKMEKTL